MHARTSAFSDLAGPGADGRDSSRDPQELVERHGAALFALAMILLRDRDRAEILAADAILDACNGPTHVSRRVDRWELARYVYVRSLRTTDGFADCGSGPKEVALALGLFGAHTYREIADLMGLTPPEVAQLLRNRLETRASL